jgi:hypothetical protein
MDGTEKVGELPRGRLPEEFLDPSRAPTPARRREHTLYPGVYFTPKAIDDVTDTEGRVSGLGESAPRLTDVVMLSREELVLEEHKLSKSIAKLKSSIDEMVEFDPDGKDADLVQARRENGTIIEQREERLEMVLKRLELLDAASKCKSG